MVEITIPLAVGIGIITLRAIKRQLEHRQKVLDELQDHAVEDVTAGVAIAIGINTIAYAAFNVELFGLEKSDLNLLLLISGALFILQGLKHVKRNILSRPLEAS